MFNFLKSKVTSNTYDGYTPSKVDADQNLRAMTPRVTDDTWEDKLLAAWEALNDAYYERPVNTVCMVVTALLILAVVLYGASYIAPITDPAR
jgi:hypothetical protein